MRDYWLTQFALQAIGWVFLGAFALALALAVWLPRGARAKIIAVAVLLGVIAVPVIDQYREFEQAETAKEGHKKWVQTAAALFDLRCKTAGEKIYRSVSDVRGVYLVNLRPDQHAADPQRVDPAGDGARGPAYIRTFLLGRDLSLSSGLSDRTKDGAYSFVEAPANGGVVRYTDTRNSPDRESLDGEALSSTFTPSRTARFGVEWADISTADDAEHWIAGTRVRVLDMETGEVLAERVGFIWDRGQGSTAGERDPWTFAQFNACPAFPKRQDKYPQTFALTRNFVERVLTSYQRSANKSRSGQRDA